jgi:glycosyltransferase involved in cell wall biosynthesis
MRKFKMRILYCNKYSDAFSGTEVYLHELMQMMEAQGHEVELFSMANQGAPAGPNQAPFVDFNDAAGIARKIRLAAHAIYSRETTRRLRRMIRDFRPDVAHVRNIYHHLSPSLLWELRAQGIPVLYHLNDFKLLCPSYNFVAGEQVCERCAGGAFWRAVAQNCHSKGRATAVVLATEAYSHRWLGTYDKCVDRFLAPTRFVRDKLVEYGVDPERIDVLYHFQRVPGTPVRTPETDDPILYFGRLSREKGVHDLLHAMQQVPHVGLWIAGDGPQRAELEQLAASLRLQNVTFLGRVVPETLPSLLASVQFTVFPTHAYETLGKTILESYACGRPVVATDLGSRRELIRGGETGLLYRCGDVNQLTAAIALLRERKEMACAMGEAGRQLVLQRHSPAEHYDTLLKIYSQIADPERGVSPPKTADARQRLKVAFIGGRGVVSRYSGIESYYEEVGSRLVRLGHKVTVYCRSYFTPAGRYRGMDVLRLPTVRTKHLETLLHTFLSTVHACVSDCDIVHYHCLGPALFSWIPRLAGKKTVVTVQGLDWQRKKWGWVARAVLATGEWAAGRFPNRTMVVSRALQRHYRLKYGWQPAYVPNGTVLRSGAGTDTLRDRGLTPDGYTLYLGRLSPEKNCDLLVRAYSQTATDMPLVLAGGSSYSDEYMRELRKHESERIRFLGWTSGTALEELLTHATLFVLPSDLEGMSLALLDAMGAGVCVLTSDIPENCEVLEETGFTFRAGDENDLRRMLEMLLAQPALRWKMGRAAQRRAEVRYLWQSVTEQVEGIYAELVDRPRKPAAREDAMIASPHDAHRVA